MPPSDLEPSDIALGFAGPLGSSGWTNMPRYPDRNLDGVIFLYPTADCARRRERIGGTAFFAGRELQGAEAVFGQRKFVTYLVSNRHVVFEGSACVAVFNRKDGGEPDIVEIDQGDWIAHPTSDLAATHLDKYIDTARHRVVSHNEEQFVTAYIPLKHVSGSTI